MLALLGVDSIKTHSEGLLANLKGATANLSAGGSAYGLGIGQGEVDSQGMINPQNEVQGVPLTEHNAPSNLKYAMIPLNTIHEPLDKKSTRKQVSHYSLRYRLLLTKTSCRNFHTAPKYCEKS